MITELTQGAARARLAPHLGGRVTSLRLAPEGGTAVEVLLPFPEDTTDLLRWPKGGIYPLMPYSGRIRDSRLQGGHGVVVLQAYPDTAPHTLHGSAHRHPWRLLDATPSAAGMVYDHPGDAEWPWAFHTEVRLALRAPGLCEMAFSLENTAATAAPAGLGLHPFFAAPPGSRLRLSAGREWPLDALGLTGAAPTAGAAWDGALTGPVTRQLSDWGGEAGLALPGGMELVLTASKALDHLVLHRPAGVDFLCLEPVSHVVDGFNLAAQGATDTGAIWLPPGGTISASITIALRRA
jgi:aldose 1-epimerase